MCDCVSAYTPQPKIKKSLSTERDTIGGYEKSRRISVRSSTPTQNIQVIESSITELTKEERLKQSGLLPHSRAKTNYRKVTPKFQGISKSIGAFSGFGFETSNPWLF